MQLDPSEVDAIASAAKAKNCHAYAVQYAAKASAHDPADPWWFLSQVFHILIRPADRNRPFAPIGVTKNGPTMMPADISDEQVRFLKQLLGSVSNSDVCARIADVLWVGRKDHEAAHVAVEKYLISGTELENPQQWSESVARYTRAVNIARSLGKKHASLVTRVLDHVERRVVAMNGDDPRWFTERCLSVLYENKFGDPAMLAHLAMKVAGKAMDAGDPLRARAYLDIAAKLFGRAGIPELLNQTRKAVAGSFVHQAEQCERNNDFLGAQHWYEQAILSFRRVTGGKDQVTALHERLNKAGEHAKVQMRPIGGQIDISDFGAQAEESVAGLPLSDALCKFAIVAPTINADQLRTIVQELIQVAPLHATIPATTFDERGRAVHRHSGLLASDPTEREKAFQSHMRHQAAITRNLAVQATIYPALLKVLEEHQFGEPELGEMLAGSALVPPDRRDLFVRGIAAGFGLDFVVAVHLLLPQLECALRVLLQSVGVIPASLDDDAIQEDWGLGRTLSEPKLAEIFGDSLIFDLKSLLVEKDGPNLRNRVAHGMLDTSALSGYAGIYAWWLIFHMVMRTTVTLKEFVNRSKASKQEGNSTPPPAP